MSNLTHRREDCSYVVVSVAGWGYDQNLRREINFRTLHTDI